MSKLTNLERCSVLQRKIILHSILYYELNVSILTDQQFDKICRKLLKGIQYTKDYKKSDYFYVFYDFDGTTGFQLYHRLEKDDKEYLMHLAKHIYKLYQKEKKENRNVQSKNERK